MLFSSTGQSELYVKIGGDERHYDAGSRAVKELGIA